MAYGDAELLTGELACTEYYRPKHDSPYLPSHLDHVLVRDGAWGEAEVLGMCAQLKCEIIEGRMHPDYATVSDHCPVRIQGRW